MKLPRAIGMLGMATPLLMAGCSSQEQLGDFVPQTADPREERDTSSEADLAFGDFRDDPESGDKGLIVRRIKIGDGPSYTEYEVVDDLEDQAFDGGKRYIVRTVGAGGYLDDSEDTYIGSEEDDVAFQVTWNEPGKQLSAVVAGSHGKQLGRMSLRSGDWRVQCERDAFTDQIDCNVLRTVENPSVTEDRFETALLYLYGDRGQGLCVGAQNYPGSQVQLRVDQFDHHASDEACFSANQLDTILDELQAGESVVTRYQRWPYRSWIELEFDAHGFDVAYALAQWAYENFDQIPDNIRRR